MAERRFDDVGRLPRADTDNVAIATRRLERGTQIDCGDSSFKLDRTVMEGHRFAIEAIASGQELLSWGLPFGRAIRDIDPGSYICNEPMLTALRGRSIDFSLPDAANFQDHIEAHVVDEARFEPREQVERSTEIRTFDGFDRGVRGTGTRNYLVVLGTTSQTASFARLLADRMRESAERCPAVDGVVAVSHTEGAGSDSPNNRDFVLRTLAGFAVHPNVGGLLAADYGTEAITNRMLEDYLRSHDYPLDSVRHRFSSIGGAFEESLDAGESLLREWLAQEELETRRTQQPAAELKLALQCGGSDAFSGISGNPLAAWAAREVIRQGGAANLAETDELIGAEPYVLQNVRDVETARKFLHMVERFKERVSWHGASAEGNPSGGNKFRGLYNIVLKSIGAAMKRHPEVRLDYVIDYGEPMKHPGYYFMDSPGNDLESIAGQVASGSNVIFFVTGNGSVTNFPFVPTIKIVTTTSRYELLARDMDVNAGAYQDGTPMEELGKRLVDLTLDVASGARSRGEEAGHSQVSLWRDWRQVNGTELGGLLEAAAPGGVGKQIQTADSAADMRFDAIRVHSGLATDQVGLILPTSLCSGQVARMAAARLNQIGLGRDKGISRFVALPHTEGCGVSGGFAEQLFTRTMLGYLTHPLVKEGLLLEHGCEKTHNDYLRGQLEELGIDAERFGWASVQMNGGIDRTLDGVETWFRHKLSAGEQIEQERVGLECLQVGLLSAGEPSREMAASFARLTQWVVGAGGSVVVAEATELTRHSAFVEPLLGAGAGSEMAADLAYGQRFEAHGFYVMESITDHWVETLTGMAATGVEILLCSVGDHPRQGHPMLPLLQVTDDRAVGALYGQDLDCAVEFGVESGEPSSAETAGAGRLLQLLLDVASRQYRPRASTLDNTDFQVTRGLLGVSM